MRWVLFAAVLAAGCDSSKPATESKSKEPAVAKADDPPKRDSPKPAEKKGKAADAPKKDAAEPKKAPEGEKVSLTQARVRLTKLDKAGVKAMLGPPTHTVMGTYNGVNTVVWVYLDQKLVWNDDTEKYYPSITVEFYEVNGAAGGNAIRVGTL